ncbi:MAG: PD40 domain-containing protein [Ruminococcus sp.]|nr:PD40 domain-containing protein [Ruminococcus sp.]
MKIIKAVTSALVLSLTLNRYDSPSSASYYPDIDGTLLYHSYSSYTAMDSNVCCYDFRTGSLTEISSDSFVNAMNADFGSHPYDVTFMAIDIACDEWDIYRYNALTNKIENLTPNSGFRNEDPKFSPDGFKIVFKRGSWSHELNDFVYNLAEIDLRTNEITMLTDDVYEDSMPFYSCDGNKVCYARSYGGSSSIYELDLRTAIISPVYEESGVTAYYPMVSGDDLYFTKWYSAENHNDTIVKFADDEISLLPFNSADYNCSDPYPFGDSMFFSSTVNGSYDIFLFDGADTHETNAVNTELHELGSSFFSAQESEKVLTQTAGYILGKSTAESNLDADGDGIVSSLDLTAFRHKLQPPSEEA